MHAENHSVIFPLVILEVAAVELEGLIGVIRSVKIAGCAIDAAIMEFEVGLLHPKRPHTVFGGPQKAIYEGGPGAGAAGVHPKTAQDIMRNSDINLTISRYSHIYRGAAVEAVTKLPDLSTPLATEQGQATGTYHLAPGQGAAHLQRAEIPEE